MITTQVITDIVTNLNGDVLSYEVLSIVVEAVYR